MQGGMMPPPPQGAGQQGGGQANGGQMNGGQPGRPADQAPPARDGAGGPPPCGGGHGGEAGAGGGAGAPGAAGAQGAGGRQGPRRDPRRLAGLLARAADTDASHDLSADEVTAFLAALGADDAGVISVDALVALLPAPPADANRPAPDATELAARLSVELDHDADGAVELEDVQWFLSLLDHDADGAVSAAELAPPRPLRGKARGAAMALARAADADDSHDVTAEEWTAFIDGLVVDADGAVSLDDLASKLPAPKRGPAATDTDTTKRDAMLVRCFDRDGDGVVEVSDLETVYSELDRSADGALNKREARAKR